MKVQHPDYLTLDGRQLADWRAYARLNPFGWERFDLGIARLCRMQPTAREGSTLKDFMPTFGPVDPPSPADLMARSLAAFGIHPKA